MEKDGLSPLDDDLRPLASPRMRIKRMPASLQIRDALRERIIALDFLPGQGLSRTELAREYGVSQTPVRDAMLKLEEEGLLVIYPQSKTEVSRIDVDQARETQFLRLSLELEVTRRLVLAGNPQRLAPVRRVAAEQEAALAEDDLDRFSRLDRSFHHALCALVGAANLWQLVTAQSGHIDRLRNLNLPDPGKPADIMHYHRRILEGIEAGNPMATEVAVREHLSGTLAMVPEIMARYPDYF